MNVGDRVRRIKGNPEDVGRVGTVEEILGSMSGDTLISVREADGGSFRCYERQVVKVTR